MTQFSANFSVGQIILHRLFQYRGVIVDVDPVFQGSDEWYEEVALSRPPKNKPWYRVLVHGKEHETYVAERNLMPDDDPTTPIAHPLVGSFFSHLEEGKYQRREKSN